MRDQSAALREASNGGGLPLDGPGAFDRNVAALLERTEYRRCDSGEDMEAIYRLRYKAFRTHGLVADASDRTMYDNLDDAPNCLRFGLFVDGELAATVRLHHVTEAHPFSPAVSVFEEVLRPRLAKGDTFIDPSRLAVDPDRIRSLRALPYLTLRLAVAATGYFQATSCLAMIRDEHIAFYQKVFRSVQIAQPRPYAGVTVNVLLFESNRELNLADIIRRFPFFYSTPFEKRMLFAKPQAGELAPLTILPTAKYLRAA